MKTSVHLSLPRACYFQNFGYRFNTVTHVLTYSFFRNSLVNEDPLHASSARLSVYRAIASPAYLVHVSSDPILTAFRLTAELADNAAAYRHIAGAYLQLSDDVSAFAVDLIGEAMLSLKLSKLNTLC